MTEAASPQPILITIAILALNAVLYLYRASTPTLRMALPSTLRVFVAKVLLPLGFLGFIGGMANEGGTAFRLFCSAWLTLHLVGIATVLRLLTWTDADILDRYVVDARRRRKAERALHRDRRSADRRGDAAAVDVGEVDGLSDDESSPGEHSAEKEKRR